MEPTHRPEPEERDAPLERVEEADAMQYPGHDRPDDVREEIGLGGPQRGEPQGAPPPDEPDRGAPVPLDPDEAA